MQFDQSSKIAFLGMGLMGSRMTIRLLNAGFQVSVWNRTAAACEALIQQGATLVDFNRIADYDLILSCLADDHAVEHVFTQIENGIRANQVMVDFSSLSVEKTQDLARRTQAKKCDLD